MKEIRIIRDNRIPEKLVTQAMNGMVSGGTKYGKVVEFNAEDLNYHGYVINMGKYKLYVFTIDEEAYQYNKKEKKL